MKLIIAVAAICIAPTLSTNTRKPSKHGLTVDLPNISSASAPAKGATVKATVKFSAKCLACKAAAKKEGAADPGGLCTKLHLCDSAPALAEASAVTSPTAVHLNAATDSGPSSLMEKVMAATHAVAELEGKGEARIDDTKRFEGVVHAANGFEEHFEGTEHTIIDIVNAVKQGGGEKKEDKVQRLRGAKAKAKAKATMPFVGGQQALSSCKADGICCHQPSCQSGPVQPGKCCSECCNGYHSTAACGSFYRCGPK